MKICLIKEPSILREGIVNVLRQGLPGHETVACGARYYRALINEQENTDVFIIDLDTDIDIISTVQFLKNRNKKIIIWTSQLDNDNLFDLFKLDLQGYLFNGMEKEELIIAIMSVVNGETYIHQTLTPILLGEYVRINKKTPNKPVGVFTHREWEILELLTKGFKNEQIGKFLFLSEKTVKYYVSCILKKMDVPDRTNAVLTALRNKWFFI